MPLESLVSVLTVNLIDLFDTALVIPFGSTNSALGLRQACLTSSQEMTQAPLIGFEGPIGAGKTTLTTLLAAHTGYEAELERFEENEFLSDFYSDQCRWALPMQLWFLVERHKQLEKLTKRRHTPIVADYTGMKNEVFAELLLNGRELELYIDLAASLSRIVRLPDVVVYLDARDDVLLERIKRRAYSYESNIDGAYLGGVRRSYEAHLGKHTEATVVRVDTTDLDLSSTTQMERLFEKVLRAF